MILMLEDDPRRIRRFRRTLRKIDAEMRLQIWRDAHRMIDEVIAHLSEARLISLDHDLEPIENEEDPGEGRMVSQFLVQQPIKRPVIVHSSNRERSDWMMGDFELEGWRCWRVSPLGEDWIEVDWRYRVQRLLKRKRN